MERKISKIVLLTLLISFLFVSMALAHTGEQHIELSDPEPGVDQVEEPGTSAKPDQPSEATKTKSSEKESSEKKTAAPSESKQRTEKTEAVDHSEMEDHDSVASYEIITPAQPGYIFAVAIVLLAVALLAISVFFL